MKQGIVIKSVFKFISCQASRENTFERLPVGKLKKSNIPKTYRNSFEV